MTSYELWAAHAASARERASADPALIPHGTRCGYEYWACRCLSCGEANRLAKARTKARRKIRRGIPLTDFDRRVLEMAS